MYAQKVLGEATTAKYVHYFIGSPVHDSSVSVFEHNIEVQLLWNWAEKATSESEDFSVARAALKE